MLVDYPGTVFSNVKQTKNSFIKYINKYLDCLSKMHKYISKRMPLSV